MPAGSTRTGSGPAAADPLHQRIIAAWREVLHVDDIGPDDTFFHLGGDSFAAVRAMYAVDRTLPVVFGDADATLPNFVTDYHDWSWYACTVDVAVVPGGGHYCIGTHAADVAALIDHQYPDETAEPSMVRWQAATNRCGRSPVGTGIVPALAGRNGR